MKSKAKRKAANSFIAKVAEAKEASKALNKKGKLFMDGKEVAQPEGVKPEDLHEAEAESKKESE